MSFFARFRQAGVDFGDLDPHDLPNYWRLYCALERARDSPSAEQLLQNHRIAGMAHWRRIVMAMGARHGDSPAFVEAARRVTMACTPGCDDE